VNDSESITSAISSESVRSKDVQHVVAQMAAIGDRVPSLARPVCDQELQTRLRVLHERHAAMWSVREMLAVLASAGVVYAEGSAPDKDMLREHVQALSALWQQRWESRAMVADGTTVAQVKARMISRKFRSRGAKHQPAGDTTHRCQDGFLSSDDEDADGESTMRSSSSSARSHRMAFRARGTPREASSARSMHMRLHEDEDAEMLQYQLHRALVPEFADGSVWDDWVEALGHCLIKGTHRAGLAA